MRFDVVIVGGGPAGINAALLLGRVRRQVLLADAGSPRGSVSHAMHGMLSRDGADPAEVRGAGRAELAAYESVQVRDTQVTSATAVGDEFEVRLADGSTVQARRLLLATGLTDELPPVKGLPQLWGHGAHHCPYCHGWEVRDRPIAVLGGNDRAARLALNLARLGCDVALCADGPTDLSAPSHAALSGYGVEIIEDQVLGVEDVPGHGVRVDLAPDRSLERHALFLHPATRQSSGLAAELGCTLLDDGLVKVDGLSQTTVPGVHAAGDLCRVETEPGLPAQVLLAAAQGARAAIVIDQYMLTSDVASERAPRA